MDVGDLSDSKTLTFWRTAPARFLFQLPEDVLLESLARQLNASDTVPEILLRRAMDGQGRARAEAAFVAARYMASQARSDDSRDFAASWLLLSAIGGSTLGLLGLIQELLREASRQRWDLGRPALRITKSAMRMAHCFDAIKPVLSREGFACLSEELASIHRICNDVGLPDLPVVRLSSGGAGAAPSSQNGTVIILTKVGDSERGEGLNVKKRYESLLKPLTLQPATASLDEMVQRLDQEFPWIRAVTHRLAADLALIQFAGQRYLRLRPILLVGPPGCGKTRYARRVAEIARVPFGLVPAAGSQDNRMLAGTARGWNSAQPCYPAIIMNATGCANPIVLVDEIDKVSASRRNGSIWDTLLLFTERETARRYQDECLLAPIDLSYVSWIATANDVSRVPEALLSRFSVIEVPRPSNDMFETIFAGILRDIATELGLQADMLPELDPGIVHLLRAAFSEGVSIRAIKSATTRALGEASRGVVRH